ncbi:hypothetical protein [Bradyrhizobium erythrophlei]|uniref:Uncharacterized protein n=1 Tax=Bradyrhizobium erythrophlei TaxID=1437360 RepID=A0A1H4NW72_9BRAD|nr:hypothetical protein [Bradyrhizobium erythrophlei]SEB99265.1 hypothetical protein SAMN05444164_0745 [Bradyrhizobium erythrophlei]
MYDRPRWAGWIVPILALVAFVAIFINFLQHVTEAHALEQRTRASLLAKPQPFAQYLAYDDYTGATKSLNGRIPPKGPAYQASGTGAANGIAGGGRMTLPVASQALYAFQQFNQVPRRISCLWNYPSGTVNTPPTYAFTNDTTGTLPYLHGESDASFFLLRLGVNGANFTQPAWWVSASYSLTSGVEYQSELNYDGGTNASMVMRNASTGAVLGSETVHDPQLATYAGKLTFSEFLDNLLQINRCTVEATTSYPFPTLSPYVETTFPTSASPFVSDPGFGGSVVFNAAGSVTISGSAFPAGGGMTLGALNSGDTLWASLDVTSWTGCTSGNPCAFSIVANSGTTITAIQPIPTAAGRYQFNFPINTSDSNARFIVTGPLNPGGVAYSVTISAANLYRNTPSAPPTPPQLQ